MRKLIILIGMMFVFTTIFPMMVQADVDTEFGVYPSDEHHTIGDAFDVVIYLDPGGETVTTWVLDQFLFNNTKVNATEVTIEGFWDTIFNSTGTINNTAGEITDPQSFDMTGTSDNASACNISFLAIGVGTCYLRINDSTVEDGEGPVTYHTVNSTVYIHPEPPGGSTATAYNTTQINLTWTTPLDYGSDKIVVYANSTGTPSGRKPGDLIYNGTANHFEHDGLGVGETWYYTFFAWNTTESLFSYSYQYDSETTDTPNAAPVCASPSPADSATIAYTTTRTVSVAISDAEGETITGFINCSGDSQSISGHNATYSNALTGLSSGDYTWYVNATDGSSWTRESYTFTINTKPTGGGGGGDWEEEPENSAPSVSINTALSVNVYDADGDFVTVKFYWRNGTLIGTDVDDNGDGVVSINPAALSYNTEYSWYVIANDTLDSTTSSIWTFNTTTLGISLTNEWVAIPANNSVHVWINATNTGDVNYTNVWIYDMQHTGMQYSTSNYVASMNGHIRFNLSSLNASETKSISIYFNLTGYFTNGECLWNHANVSHLGQVDDVNISGLCHELTIDVRWDDTVALPGETYVVVNETVYVNNTGAWNLTRMLLAQSWFDCSCNDLDMTFVETDLNPESLTWPEGDCFILVDVPDLGVGESWSFYIISNITNCSDVLTAVETAYTEGYVEELTDTASGNDVPFAWGFQPELRISYTVGGVDEDTSGLIYTVMTFIGILALVMVAAYLITSFNKGVV